MSPSTYPEGKAGFTPDLFPARSGASRSESCCDEADALWMCVIYNTLQLTCNAQFNVFNLNLQPYSSEHAGKGTDSASLERCNDKQVKT